MNYPNLSFIGAGNMNRAIISGLIANQYDPRCIWVSNPSSEKLKTLKELGVHTHQNNVELIEKAKPEAVILGVKPVLIKTVCLEIQSVISKHQTSIISIASGVSSQALAKWLPTDTPIILAMPNTPATVRAGATGLFANATVTETQKNLAESIFRAVGIVEWFVKEKFIEVIASISGAGPAYFFLIMEAMQEVAKNMGLSEETAKLFVTQTALGASRMAMETDHSALELRRAVTSPNGITEQAIKVLEAGNIRELFSKAIEAAYNRSEELAHLLQK